MSNEFRTADEVVKEKYEERGWDKDRDKRVVAREEVTPLSLSEEEYRSFSLLLAKLALQDQDVKLCDVYFEIQRRAFYGNGYSSIEEMAAIEQKLWSLGTGEFIIDNEKHSL